MSRKLSKLTECIDIFAEGCCEEPKKSEYLITTREDIRESFEKYAHIREERAEQYIKEALELKEICEKIESPLELLDREDLYESLLMAAGFSGKSLNFYSSTEKKLLLNDFLSNMSIISSFPSQICCKYLITRGDTVGGELRNIVGNLGQNKLLFSFIERLKNKQLSIRYLPNGKDAWKKYDGEDCSEIKGLCWEYNKEYKTLIMNINMPFIREKANGTNKYKKGNNVDLCLLRCRDNDLCFADNKSKAEIIDIFSNLEYVNKISKSAHFNPNLYAAIGELKSGIDPAGADEHWKTANHALNRIRSVFREKQLSPCLFFIGSAIERSMAEEMQEQINNGEIEKAANLNNNKQINDLCDWLIEL